MRCIASTFCCLCFLTAYMQVKCDLSMPIALEGPPAGYHEYCMPSKSKGLLPASCKSLSCPYSPVHLFCLVITRLLSPVVSPIDHFGVFRHYTTTPSRSTPTPVESTSFHVPFGQSSAAPSSAAEPQLSLPATPQSCTGVSTTLQNKSHWQP